MYDKFPVVYESNFHEYIVYLMILGAFILITFIIILFSLSKLFKKANRSGLSAFIPFYNMIVLLEIVNYPKYYFFLLLIPIFNFYIAYKIMLEVANSFRKSKLFALGLTLLPFAYFPILAFGNNEYIGINLVAMEGKTVTVDVPKIEVAEEEKTPTIHEEVDTSVQGIDISIGGGSYQKNYTNKLLEVDKTQSIEHNFSEPVKKEVVDGTFIKGLNTLQESTTKANPTQNSAGLFNVPKIEVNVPNQTSVTPTPKVNTAIPNSFPTNVEPPKVPVANTTSNLEYITCPKCGARLKKGVENCFMCGSSVK